MTDASKYKFPRYVKYFFILSNLALTGFLIAVSAPILCPLIAAMIVAILLKPFAEKLEAWGVPKILSAFSLVVLFLLLFLSLATFFTAQLANITSDTSITSASFEKGVALFQNKMSTWFNISMQDQVKLFNTYIKNFISHVVSYFPGVIAGTASYLSTLLLFIFSLFFFLYYRRFFLLFLYKLFNGKNKERVHPTAIKIEDAIKNYITGLFIVIFTIAILNSIGLLVMGIPHALFFGILASMLTIIPYVGIFIGSLFPVLLTLITKDSLWYPIGIIIQFSFIQFLEGNFITPCIVGSKTNINPYFAILGLFVGGMLLGVMGVILAIPILGIIKVIFDQIDSLEPFSYVLGIPKDNNNSKLMRYISEIYTKIKIKK